MINRNNYPLYEPVFQNWNNVGAEAEEIIKAKYRAKGKDDSYIFWSDKREYLDMICTDYHFDWAHMEIRTATKTDEGRQCKWCRQKLVQYEVKNTNEYGIFVNTTLDLPEGMEINKFKKGDIVIREQMSKTGFETLHVDCAQEKLAAVKESIKKGEDKLHRLIIASENIQQQKRRKSNQ
jgi:hypothetical protein